MTTSLAKEYLTKLHTLFEREDLTYEEELSIRKDLYKNYIVDFIDGDERNEYILVCSDGSKCLETTYEENYISYKPLAGDTSSPEEFESLCSGFGYYEDEDDEDEDDYEYDDGGDYDYERLGLAMNEFLEKYPIERIQLINELAEKHGIQNYLVLTDDDRIYCSELDRYYDEDDLWDLYDIELYGE